MTLAAGTHLGAYEVLALIGAGGMGEIYTARDTRLDRLVAVKVLPGHLTASPAAQDSKTHRGQQWLQYRDNRGAATSGHGLFRT